MIKKSNLYSVSTQSTLFKMYRVELTMTSFCFPVLLQSTFLSVYLAYLLTPPPPQSLNIYLPYCSFQLSIAILQFRATFPPAWAELLLKGGKKKQNRRRPEQRRATIYPNHSEAPERLAHLAGSDSEEEERMKIVCGKIQPSYEELWFAELSVLVFFMSLRWRR